MTEMSRFNQGDMIVLKSDRSAAGAVVEVIEGLPEARYKVFTAAGLQTFYESQIESQSIRQGIEAVPPSCFNAVLTASLIRNPSLSSLYSLNCAKIDFIPYQFRPVLKFIRSDRPRLLIADSVGVGKTIEAGLILRELQARRNLNSVLIICPRPLVSEGKWETEMERFGEEFTPLDGGLLRHCINEMYLEGEWPEKYKKIIIPYSLFDEGNVFGTKNTIGLMQTDPPRFDLVIVDEAHHIRNTATYAYRAVSRFCDAAEAVVLMTATPVQLEYDDLYVLLNLLRPDLIIDKNTFYDMAKPNSYINAAAVNVRGMKDGWEDEAYENLNKACSTGWGQKVFKNNPAVSSIFDVLKQERISDEQRVKLISDIENMHTFSNMISRTRRRDIGEFAVRKPYTVTVNFTKEQKQLHDMILDVMHRMLSQIHCTENTKFMMTTIRRQTASCLFGLVPMLEGILNRHFEELAESDDYMFNPKGLEEGNSMESIRKEIEEILKAAGRLPEDDPKFDAMMEVIDKKVHNTKKNKVMIFSSFRHTLRYLLKRLEEKGLRVGLVCGDTPDEERRELRRRFNPEETQNESRQALDILLFSEVGCEGLDYQFCDCMINYDLPWNPMKIEQRIGRIDRNGQMSESVAIYNMVTPGTVDADIYERCLIRIGVFQNSVGDCEEILGEITGEIRKLAENFSLTDEQRREKMQQMTDNKIRLIKENQELEENQRELFGIRIPQDAFDAELKNAANFWLSAENIQNLVTCYLKQRFGTDKEYIWGNSALKKLRLSKEERYALLDDYKKASLPKSAAGKDWQRWLNQGESYLDITFESKCWKENPKAVLLSITHPLVKLAADYMRDEKKTVCTLKVNSDLFAPGRYPFAVYQWKLSGQREDLQIKPVSADKELNKVLFELLKLSSSQNSEPDICADCPDDIDWDGIDKIHHGLWQEALAEHKRKTEEMTVYREASLRTSHEARMETLKDALNKNSDKKNFARMQEGKIRIAEDDFSAHMYRLEKARKSADIFFELLAYGVLIINN